MVPCRVALFPLEEFFYVTLRFFLGTLSTQSIHRSAPTRLPPDLALSSILPFRRAPLFLCRCVPFSLLFSFRALKKIPPRQPPPQPRPSIDPDPPFEARVVEPTDQTNHSQVSASVSVRVVSISISISTQPSPYARLVSPVSPGLVLSSSGSLGATSSGCSRLHSRTDIDRLLPPTPPSVALARARPCHLDNISTSPTANCWAFMVVCIRQ